MNRAQAVDDLFLIDSDGDESAPVVVHRVPCISAGLFGFSRLLNLALAGLGDVLSLLETNREGRFGLALIVGNGLYEEAWHRSVRNAEGLTGPSDEELSFQVRTEQMAVGFLPAFIRRSGIAIAAEAQALVSSTSVGFITALRHAEDWLARGVCDRCLVGGVESFLDPSSLVALDGLGLLHTDERPVGFFAGEASCFLVVETEQHARARRRPVLALLGASTVSQDAKHPALGGSESGVGDSRGARSSALDALRERGAAPGIAVVNLNGDPYRAMAWGYCLVPVPAAQAIGKLPVWYPPLSFGEIGAATGPVSVAMLARGWKRNYAPPENGLVYLMDDAGGRGALHVRVPQREVL
jgi:3-oxoacyl-[acyl-carrier-protein] synthase-1